MNATINHKDPTLPLTEGRAGVFGILSAFGAEADLLVAQIEERKTVHLNGNAFHQGQLHGLPVVVALCGISVVNAAMVSQLMLTVFGVERLLMSGIAGGVDPHCHVGDVLVPHQWMLPMEIYWGADGSVPAPCGVPGDLGPLGLALARRTDGQPWPPFTLHSSGEEHDTGMYLRANHVRRASSGATGEWHVTFPADSQMLDVARALRPALSVTGPRSKEPVIATQPRLLVGGVGATVPAFLANPQYRRYLGDQFGVRVLDMETAAVAQVAYANETPFIAMRSLSDSAGGDTERSVGAFFEAGLAEANASAVTLAFLEAWAGR